VAVVFHRSALLNEFVLDDYPLIVGNDFIAHWENAAILCNPKYILNPYPLKCGARPLTVFSLMVDYRCWGNSAFGYHLTNVLLHGLNSVVLLVIALLLFERYDGRRFLAAILCSLVFALHPLQSEVVNIASFRADLLVTLFYLLSVLFFISARHARRYAAVLLYTCSIFCFTVALFSKEIAITAPLVFVLSVLLMREKIFSRRMLALIVFASLLAIVFMACFWSIRYDYYILYNAFFPNIRGNLSPLQSLSAYVSTLCLSFGHYLQRLLLPVNLSPDYELHISRHVVTAGNLFSVLLFAGIAGLFYAIKDKVYRFGAGFWMLTYLPVSNIVPLFNTVNDRYMYLPMAGFAVAVASLVARAPQPGVAGKNGRLGMVIGVGLLLFYGGLTLGRNHIFRNGFALCRDAVTHAPSNVRVNYNLGIEYLVRNEFNKAIEQFELVSRLNPFFKRDDVWYCMGMCYKELGDMENAKKYLLRAVLLSRNREAIENIVNILWQEHINDNAK
jgi:tetratricopeptide (TPR) repeat protein